MESDFLLTRNQHVADHDDAFSMVVLWFQICRSAMELPAPEVDLLPE
jgi:hypothetical protein